MTWLGDNNQLCSVDRACLTAFCCYLSLWRKLSGKLAKMDAGSLEYRRLANSINIVYKIVMVSAREFGFTPSSRLEPGPGESKKADGLDGYFQPSE